MDGFEIKITFKINFTNTPLYIETMVFLCNPYDCNIEVVIVNIAVKNTPIDKIDNNGAALATDFLSLKRSDNIGPDKTDIPIAHGIEIMEANFKQECMTLTDASLLWFRSSCVFEFFIADKEAVSVGVSEDAIG